MNKFRVACFQTTSSDIAEENIIMLEKIFSNVFLFFLIHKLKLMIISTIGTKFFLTILQIKLRNLKQIF